MLALVSAARESDIEMHLQAEKEFLKLVFAFDHVHYSRYNTFQHVFLNNEKRLDSDVYQDLLIHGHVASVTGDTFSGVSGDLLCEWFNKETKGSAAPFRSGYSTEMKALNTWVRTSHIHCALKSNLKQKLRIHTSCIHKELSPGSKKRHTQHVTNLKNTLKTYNVDMFSDGPARSITSGEKIDENIVNELLGADRTGEQCYNEFVTQRLVTGVKSFFDPIKRNKLRTGLTKEKIQNKQISVLKEDRQAFGILISKTATLDEAFQYPLTTVPLSIAETNSSLRQGNQLFYLHLTLGNHDLQGSVLYAKLVEELTLLTLN